MDKMTLFKEILSIYKILLQLFVFYLLKFLNLPYKVLLSTSLYFKKIFKHISNFLITSKKRVFKLSSYLKKGLLRKTKLIEKYKKSLKPSNFFYQYKNKLYRKYKKTKNILVKNTRQSLKRKYKKLIRNYKKLKSIKLFKRPKRRGRPPKNKKPFVKLRPLFVFKGIVFGSLLLLIGLASLLVYYSIFYTMPSSSQLDLYRPSLTSYFYAQDGTLLFKNYKDENRTLVSLKDVPYHLQAAIISIEDKNFYEHTGISLEGIFRSAYANYKNQEIVQGGSTITQQLAKNIFLSPKKTYVRKIKEILLAILLEQKYTKDEILQTYLNTVPFGGTSYGVQEAAKMYFNKDVKDLNLAEAALLAGLPAAPTDFSPYTDFNSAKRRQKKVLLSMVREGYITLEEAVKAYEQPLDIKNPKNSILYPHFVFYVNDYLVSKYGKTVVKEGGLKIYTTLDPEIQDMAQDIVSKEIETLKRLRISNGAALVTKARTGEIVAMVGSKDFYSKEIDGYVNLTTSLRQPGSSIKPFNYSLALKNGMTAATLINDKKVVYKTPGSPAYIPKNYDGKFRGPVTIRRALSNSLNIPSVKVLEKNGVQNFVNYVRNFGITTWNNDYYGLSLALGAAEVKMIEMNEAYGVFSNLGYRVKVTPIKYILTSKGDVLEYNPCLYKPEDFKGRKIINNPGKCKIRAIPAENAFIITSILNDFKARAETFGYNSILNVPGTASKTGTTNDLRDNWTFGFNREFVVGTWVGNNDNSPMSYVASGITGASPIWAKIIKELTNDTNKINIKELKPENVIQVNLCPITYQLACKSCGGYYEYFIKGTEPKRACSDSQIKKIKKDKEKKKDKKKKKKKD